MKCWDKNYLVTVDYYSIFWEIDYVENTLSSTIINKLRSHFSRHEIPDIVFSDNGPQFDCSEFRKLASLCGIQTRNIITIISAKQWECRTSS
jgi:hypothetical protein